MYNHSQHMTNIKKQRNHITNALLAKPLAQAEGPHSGERILSLRRAHFALARARKGKQWHSTHSRLGETPSPERDTPSLETRFGLLSDNSRKRTWASLYLSRLGETSSLGRDYQFSLLFAPASTARTYQTSQPSILCVHSSIQSQEP